MLNKELKAWFKAQLENNWDDVKKAWDSAGVKLTDEQIALFKNGKWWTDEKLEALVTPKVWGFLGWKDSWADGSWKKEGHWQNKDWDK